MDHGFRPFQSEELTAAVHDNLRNLGLDVLDVVNLRSMFSSPWTRRGVDRGATHSLGRTSATRFGASYRAEQRYGAQIAEARRIAPIVCVQNMYNLVHRADDALIDDLARDGIAYVPFFPLGGFSPLQSAALSAVAARLGATPMQVALAWLLQRSPNILLIPGTSSVEHLRENLKASMLRIPSEVVAELDSIGRASGHS